MIPALICPFLRPDLVGRMVASVDEPVERWITIDNGSGADAPGVIHLPANLGVSASWNLGIKLTIDAPWWAIVNDDVVFAPGDLAALVAAMSRTEPMIVTLDGFSAFGIRREVVERVGLFDESFHPAYCEDADYEYRCKLAGIEIVALAAGLTHARSSTIADPDYGAQNSRTYPVNHAYFRARWGGGIRGGETLTSPFGRGGAVGDWTLDVARLRELRWQ